MPASLWSQCPSKKSCSNGRDALGLDARVSGPERCLGCGPWKSVSCPAPFNGPSGIPGRFLRVDIAARHASRSIHIVEPLSHRGLTSHACRAESMPAIGLVNLHVDPNGMGYLCGNIVFRYSI